jgi:hypothetical protein
MAQQKSIIVVAGLDQEQRPHAARFTQSQETLATKAAALMGFKVGMAQTSRALTLARTLTKGRIFATGRALVPYVRQEVFDEMQTAIAFEEPSPIEIESSPAPDGDPLAIGNVVLATESKEGWWEAIVLDVENDRVGLRWRDWPKLKRFTRSRAEIAIIGAALTSAPTP